MDIESPGHGWLSLPSDHPADKADNRSVSVHGNSVMPNSLVPPRTKQGPQELLLFFYPELMQGDGREREQSEGVSTPSF